jgi:serine-type D-Ala-D-Ala carboxypeptidase/endopeptidase
MPGAADPAVLFAERAAFVPGSTIAWGVLRDGGVVTGCTNAVTDPGLYQIGSITKLFTGSLLALLVRRGVVRLDTRIGELIDHPLVDAVADITLLQLATHTAGLPRLPPDMRAENGTDPYANFGRDALFGFVAKQQTGAIVDGRGSFDYSNFGVSVLGEVLAVATGRSYADLLAEELFRPLGMRDTFVATPDAPVEVPAGTNADGEPMPIWHFDAFAPAGGAVATVADVLAFARALCENTIPVVEALRDAMLPRAPVREGGSVGLCWMCEDTLRWHNGQTFGHHAMLALDLAAGSAAVALWNTAASLDDICFHLVRPSRELAVMPVEEPLSLQALSRYAGTYEKEYPKGATFWIVADERGLILNDATHFRLYSESAERFFAKQIPGVDFTFVLDADGEATGIEQTLAGVPGVPAIMRAQRQR